MENIFYGLIAFGVLLVLGLTLYFIKTKSKVKEIKKVLPQLNLDRLYLALGQKENILNISIEHQRVKVELNDTKAIDINEIKTLNIPAFLTGKTLKLLIKENPQLVVKYIDNKRKEEN